MTILKCKICGGNIEATGASHGICDSCGVEVTLPKIDDDRRADMYNRGNHFRMMGNFDEAYSAYEHIISENNRDAEAHWNLVLCRYGIEYVEDVRRGVYLPTCSRLNNIPIYEDIDYLAAVEYADEYSKDIYRREAQRIYVIQNRYLEISHREKPYDVFICFKAEDDHGERTNGSVVAQEIYTMLEKEGLRVFFSRITLEDKLGEDYEPYIYAALNSAKIMLVVSDKKEHLYARWVKNEWMRYLSIMDNNHSKSMIPVCVGMSPKELPNEMPRIQAVEWSKIGASQDLLRGILKITGNLVEKTVAVSQNRPLNVENTLKAVERAIDDKDFSVALKQINRILSDYPENGMAHFYFLLANYNASNLEELPIDVNWEEESRFKRALQYADDKTKAMLEKFASDYKKERIYREAHAAFKSKGYDDAIELFYSISDYKDSYDMSVKISKIRQEFLDYKTEIEEFDKEVGNHLTYLKDKMNNRHPSAMTKLKELAVKKNKWEKLNRGYYFGFTDMIAPLLMLISALYICITLDVDSVGFPLVWGISTLIFVKHLFDLDFGMVLNIILTVMLMCIPPLVIEFFKCNFFAVLIYLLISISGTVVLLCDILSNINSNRLKREINGYYKSILIPHSEKIISELKEKYSEKAIKHSEIKIEKMIEAFEAFCQYELEMTEME